MRTSGRNEEISFKGQKSRNKDDILREFHIVADYICKKGIVPDSGTYSNDFRAFLLHAHHLKPYDFIIPYCEGKKILEIGCFLGYGTARIAKSAGEVTAIDSDKDALAFARDHMSYENAVFLNTDAKQLPFADGSFDLVVAFQLIEHLPPPEVGKFLLGTKRVLKENGMLFLITPNRSFRLLPFQRPFNPEHYQEFTEKKLRKILKTYFSDIEIKGLRAEKWIEEIERKRVRRPYPLYIKGLVYGLLTPGIKSIVSKLRSKPPQEAPDRERFESVFRKFSLSDFYLENRDVEKSMDLFAICKK